MADFFVDERPQFMASGFNNSCLYAAFTVIFAL